MLIPAVYSTVEASRNPDFAGTLDRVDKISALIRQVATEQDVRLNANDIQPLFRDRALKAEMTIDGVHLNDNGKRLYRKVLLNIFNNANLSAR